MRKLYSLLLLVVLSGILTFFSRCKNDAGTLNTVTVSPLYSSAAKWNDYVMKTDTNLPCTATSGGYDNCIHGGEVRKVSVENKSACTGLTANDSLGAFNWVCTVDNGSVYFNSTGLEVDKNLADLIDFSTGDWKLNQVSIYENGALISQSSMAKWWNNTIEINNSGGSLTTESRIYLVTAASIPATYAIGADKTALVIQPGVTAEVSAAGSTAVISASAKKFLWIEGTVNSTGNDTGLYLDGVSFSVLRNISVQNADYASGLYKSGIYLNNVANNKLINITTKNNGANGIHMTGGSSENTLSYMTSSDNTLHGLYFAGNVVNNTIDNITANENSGNGIMFDTNGDNSNILTNILAARNVDAVSTNLKEAGIYIKNSRGIKISNAVSVNNNNYGIYLQFNGGHTLSDITTVSNTKDGIRNYLCSDNTIYNVTTANNGGDGVYVGGGTAYSNNIFVNITTVNNDTGIMINTVNSVVYNVTTANQYNHGINLSLGNNSVVSNTAAANTSFGIVLMKSNGITLQNLAVSHSSNGVLISNTVAGTDYFTGVFKVGNCTDNCDNINTAADHTQQALDGTKCTTTGLDGSTTYPYTGSDAVFRTGIDLSGSYKGKVTDDDAVNQCDTNGSADYDSVLSSEITGWYTFAGAYRTWGVDGTYLDAATKSNCGTTETCRIYDWTLKNSDTYLLNALILKTTGDAANTITHNWASGSVTFLRNAVEIMGDGSGNENGLCETGETCLYTPNIGSYQGHGDLIDVTFTDGDTLTGITLKKYSENGH